MQDNDVEEDYHALFIQRSLMQAGFETKILHGLGRSAGMPPGS
jgi:glutathionylspermidine amidase/synthetase